MVWSEVDKMVDPIDIEKEIIELDEEAKKQKLLEEKIKKEEEERRRIEEELRKREEEREQRRLSRPSDFDEDFIIPLVENSGVAVRCLFRDCHQCCLETEMLLTTDDLAKLIDAGYSPEDFCYTPREADGFWQLKNVDGRCYFLSESGKCTVYPIRPEGCRLYPLILTLDTNEVVVDDDCREQEWFEKQVYERQQVMEVHNLVSTLLLEREDVTFED